MAVNYNFVFTAVYIRSEDDLICDALSRLDNDQNATGQRLADPEHKHNLCDVKCIMSI